MENGPGGIHISPKREQCLLLIHGEHIVPGDDAGGGDGGFFQAAPLPGQQLVGALDAEIAHAVGILHDQRVHHAGL